MSLLVPIQYSRDFQYIPVAHALFQTLSGVQTLCVLAPFIPWPLNAELGCGTRFPYDPIPVSPQMAPYVVYVKGGHGETYWWCAGGVLRVLLGRFSNIDYYTCSRVF